MTEIAAVPTPETPAPDAPMLGESPVRAVVAEAMRSAKAAMEPNTETAAAPAEPDASSSRARDERGKFISKAEGADEPAAEAAPVTDADPVADQVDAPSEAIDPPTNWSADEKALWASAPVALQKAVARREQQMADGQRQWSERERSYTDMLNPVAQAAKRAGIDTREGLDRLLSANEWLERDPEGAIRSLAKHHGLEHLFSANPTTQPARPQADPTVVAMQQKLSTIEAAQQQQARDQQAREQAAAMSEITAFKAAPGHEHFDALQVTMGRMMAMDPALDLNDAYEKAAWADPTIREKLISARTAKAEADRKAKEREAADKAKRGAISVNGSHAPGAVPTAPKAGISVRDAVRDAFRVHSAG